MDRVPTKIRYQREMKKALREYNVDCTEPVSVAIDFETGYLYLVVPSTEDVLYYSLMGNNSIREMLGI